MRAIIAQLSGMRLWLGLAAAVILSLPLLGTLMPLGTVLVVLGGAGLVVAVIVAVIITLAQKRRGS